MNDKQIGIFVILLIVFFPAAFIYLAVVKKGSKPTSPTRSNTTAPARSYDYKNSFPDDTVWVNKGSKIYHSDPYCTNQTSNKKSNYIPLKKAQKLEYRPYKKYCNSTYYK